MTTPFPSPLPGVLAVLAAVALPAAASAGYYFAEYFGDTIDASTATYTSLGTSTNDGVPGVDFAPDAGLNPQYAIYATNTTSGNTRRFRFRNDLRGGQNDYVPQAGQSLTPVGYTGGGDVWNVASWSNVQIGSGAAHRYSSENWPDDGNAGDVGTPSFGFAEGLNWGLVSSTDGGGIGFALDDSGRHVYAVGIVWDDVDEDGNVDTGDNLWLRYIVGADSFAELDTTEELNAVVNGTIVVNHPPVFSADPFSAGNATQDVSYNDTIAGSATDADGDPLSYAKVSGPAWLNVATHGVLSGTPTLIDLGVNAFTVEASDGEDADTATLNVTVEPAPSTTSNGTLIQLK